MAEIGFYHLQRSPLDRVLPKLLDKILSTGKRAVVVAGSEERVEALAAALWTFEAGSFLPHGTRRDGHAEDQPVWLTDLDENPNDARFAVLVDGASIANLDAYERCLEIFDGNDDEAVAAARARWKGYRDAGHTIKYYQQTDAGGWEQKA